MSEPLSPDAADRSEAKACWHREQAALPLKEKVGQRPLRPWEKPWPVEP